MRRQGRCLMDDCALNVLKVMKGKMITTHRRIQFLSAPTS